MPHRSPDNTPNEIGQVDSSANETETFFPEPSLSPQVIALIGESLRAYYDRMMLEPVPEHLLRLVDSLDREGRADNET